MELRQYLSIVRKWLWLIILGAVLGGGSALAFSLYSTPTYQSTATLLISQGQNASGVTYNEILTGQNIAATYVEQIKSPVVLKQVVADLELPFTPAELLRLTTVQQTRNTLLINVSVEDANPARAQAIADRIGKDFIALNADAQQVRYQAAQKDLDSQVADLRKKIDETQKALVPLGDPSDPKSATAPDYVRTERLRLQMELNTLQAQYTVLLKSAQDFRLAASQSGDSVSIFTPAQLPSTPIRPQTRTNALLGLVVGLMLAVGVAFLVEYLDDTVKSSDDVTRVLDLSTLGTVLRFPHVGKPRDSLITFTTPRAPYAEAFRNLRTNLQFSLLNHNPSTLVITSAEPGEGKTTTLANLAVVMAQTGKRVIMVDTDLRRPALHKLFEAPQEPGLTDLILQEGVNLDSVLVDTPVQGLRLLPSGTLPPNPAELLSSHWFDDIVTLLKERADVILFDSPPILPVTDAVILAAKTGNVVWVIGAGTTRTDMLRKAYEALHQVEAKVLGAVLNKLSVRRGGYGYYYYNYYYYAKDGQKKKKQKRAGGSNGSLPAAPLAAHVAGNGKDPATAISTPESLEN